VVEWYALEEDVADALRRAQEATDIAEELRASRPLRTVLQTILVVRNILGQQGCPGYTAKSLEHIYCERLPRHAPTTWDPVTGLPVAPAESWIRENTPTVLLLVARMLEATHARRCRLRFMRMLAVGRFLKSGENICRITWSYLDDLHESPRDAVTLLRKCNMGICDRDLAGMIVQHVRRLRRLQAQELSWLREGTVEGLFADQIAELRVRVAEAIQAVEGCGERAAEAAAQFCHLAGETRAAQATGAACFDTAGAMLSSLRCLGQRLHVELAGVQEEESRRRLARQPASASSRARAGGRSRTWEPVDTSHLILATRDPELIRELRGGRQGAAAPAPAPEGPRQPTQAKAKAEAKAKVTQPALFANLMHGGQEGQYRRDPVTGKWGPRLDGLDGTCATELMLGGPQAEA